MEIIFLLLAATVAAGLWAVMTGALLRAAIALALLSAILTVVMFRLNAPLAGVFELSVCSGLISVVFISVISLTHRLPYEEYMARRRSRISRFWLLPLILVFTGLLLFYFYRPVNILPVAGFFPGDVRQVMWDLRRIDLFGQVVVLLAGVYGVLILFKGKKDGR